MISIIVCSVKPELLAIFKKNVAETIGDIEYEFVDIDNRERKWPIAKAYNEGAKMAKYPYLLFAHEDIEFLNNDWGRKITDKLSEEDCGVIGFAGGVFKPATISGWSSHNPRLHRENYHAYHKGELRHNVVNHTSDFGRVITLDGLALFVRRNVWEEFPFDEKVLTGFHCYDIDFTMQISMKYKNYVSFEVHVLHKSKGSYDAKWLDASFSIMREKWDSITPMSLDPMPDKTVLQKVDEELLWYALKISYNSNSPYYDTIVKSYMALPCTLKHLGRTIRLFIKYRR